MASRAAFLPPPASKASHSMRGGGRTERHGLSSPMVTINADAFMRAKPDGVPRWGCLSRARPATPTRCVQRLDPAVALAERLAKAGPNRGRTVLPPRHDEGIAFVLGGGKALASHCIGT